MLRWFFGLLGFYSAWAMADMDRDRLWQVQQDREWQRRQDNQEAEKVVVAAPVAEDIDELTLALLQAANAYDGQALRRLLAEYEQRVGHDEDMVLFARATLAVQQDNLKEAVRLYRLLLVRYPDFVRGKLDLARLLFVDKQNREAAALFAQADSEVTHAVVKEKIASYRAALRERDDWNGSLAVGLETVSNLNQSSEKTVYREQNVCTAGSAGVSCISVQVPASAASAIRAWGAVYEAAVDRRLSLSGSHGLQMNAYALGRIYHGLGDYHEHYLGLAMGYSYQDRRHTLGVRPVYRLTFLGQSLQKRGAGLQLEGSREWANGAYMNVQLEHLQERYVGREYRRFDGGQTSLWLYMAKDLPANWMMFGGYDYLRKDSVEAVDSYRRHGVRVGLAKQLPFVVLSADVAMRRVKYQDYHAWLGTRRDDRETVYRASARFSIPKTRLTPMLEYEYSRNQSSSWVNAYRNAKWRFKLGYVF